MALTQLPITGEWATSDVVTYTITNPTQDPQPFVIYRGLRGGPFKPYLYGGAYGYCCYPFEPARGAFYRSMQLPDQLPANWMDPNSLVLVETGWPWKLVAYLFVVPANGTLQVDESIPHGSVFDALVAYVVRPVNVQNRTIFWSPEAKYTYLQQRPGSVCATAWPYDAGPVLSVTPVDPTMPRGQPMLQFARDGTVGDFRVRLVLGAGLLAGLLAFGSSLARPKRRRAPGRPSWTRPAKTP